MTEKNREQKKKRPSQKKPKHITILIGFVVSVAGFGLFSGLLVAALSCAEEKTILKLTVSIPAWMLVAVCGFAGLLVTFLAMMYFEKKIMYKTVEQQIKIMSTKLDLVLRETKIRKFIATSRVQNEERLPYESLDDLFEDDAELTDEDIENLTEQLILDKIEEEEEKEMKTDGGEALALPDQEDVPTTAPAPILAFDRNRKSRKKKNRKRRR